MAAVKSEEADVRMLINRALTKTRVADGRFYNAIQVGSCGS